MGASVRMTTVDWPKIILSLRGAGLSRPAIARKAGVAPNTISAYQSGQTREPPYSVGVRLIELHQKAVAL